MSLQAALILLGFSPYTALDTCADILLCEVRVDFPTNMKRFKCELYREKPKVEYGTNREDLSQKKSLYFSFLIRL